MDATVSDIAGILDEIAPPVLAESWDNVGLQVGRMDWPGTKIWVALDPLPEVVMAACHHKVNLLVTHHPLILKPLQQIDLSSPVGSIIQNAIDHRLSIFSAHTNLDSASGGVNEVLAETLGLKNLTPFTDQHDDLNKLYANSGIGRMGTLSESVPLRNLAAVIKKRLNLKSVKMAGNPELPVKKIAVCSGSGSGLLSTFFSSGADAYISGDLKYHDARDAEQRGLGLIDIGHFASEHLIVRVLSESIQKLADSKDLCTTVTACDMEDEPFSMV